MSEELKHECGIALIRLRKPLQYYYEKYGTGFWGLNKLYLLLEKQHNRGQDGAGIAVIKFDTEPGTRYISRKRSADPQPIKDIFTQVNQRISEYFEKFPDKRNDVLWQKENMPYTGELLLGHVRYGTYGGNSIEHVHPFLRPSNWKHRSLIVAGNFNMTNSQRLLEDLIAIGQHPKERTDTVTVMEKIGHFLDKEVESLYQRFKKEKNVSKLEASALISKHIDVASILKKSSKKWDGGYVMAGLMGHGDSFVLRDPAGIRPAFYYIDDEVIAVASERPALQTIFNTEVQNIRELPPGNALIIKKAGEYKVEEIRPPISLRPCSFERIYFSRGNDADIYRERKMLGKLLFPQVLESINYDLTRTVFSYIPNTAESSFYGLREAAGEYLNAQKAKIIADRKDQLDEKQILEILNDLPRFEKIAIKDAKLRTFITEDQGRDDLVAHVYDITYGVVKPEDNLVIIDDSIVRGTTLKESILRITDRLHPRKIIVLSSAPQIRYPDCYGIDMAKLGDFIAFRAAIDLLKENGKTQTIIDVYHKCKRELEKEDDEMINAVKEIYDGFTPEQISKKIASMLKGNQIRAEVEIVFQTIENLHKAIPAHTGDWYFTGDYPTPGGNRVVNEAFVRYYLGDRSRAY